MRGVHESPRDLVDDLALMGIVGGGGSGCPGVTRGTALSDLGTGLLSGGPVTLRADESTRNTYTCSSDVTSGTGPVVGDT